ncbi:MAG: hypothetical protein PHX87_00540 [Candidatus Peribacteraceae bacterium]|nr:hypothetical protein [Candidatus Peribacteraceae bacterium]MDD5741896.1 hypothetical protein [Candidatus Peribacteraceae bacterium]
MLQLFTLPVVAFILALFWGFLLRFKLISNEQIITFINQLISIFVSVSLGFAVYLYQQSLITDNQASALKSAVIEETKIIMEAATGAVKHIAACNPNHAVLPLFPHANIERAATSDFFAPGIIRLSLYLNSHIEEHNRWVSNADNNISLGPTNLEAIDLNIYTYADFLQECLLTGTSKYDKDCY